MAEASKSVTTVVTLTLDADEAQVLTEVLACVGGSPDNSPRGTSERILNSLRGLGYEYTPHGSENYPFEPYSRSLMFKDYPSEVPVGNPWTIHHDFDEPPF